MSDKQSVDDALGRDGCHQNANYVLPREFLHAAEEGASDRPGPRKSRSDSYDPEGDGGGAAIVGMAMAALSGAIIGFLAAGNATFAIVVVMTAIVSAYAGWQVGVLR
ncbi:hypothetical protein [Methylosinus sp. KRF6]|uniref:hypothetical protein n=1 Tax=Methylosinus sp. KRF6 TaxID=2846853 RepID=UPI001C0B61DD|nr:hypothetical protein [Methylosinus sp. KRF6]MBU3890916.1 hypothetical protein [Methylosinus sp. KRF6]